MVALPRIPRMGEINWEQFLSRKVPKVHPSKSKMIFEQGVHRALYPDDYKEAEIPLQSNGFSPEDLRQLRSDLANQIYVYGPEEAAQVVPAGDIRQRIKTIAKGGPEQRIGGGIGAIGGGLLGAGAGALVTGLAKGKAKAPLGLLGGIPAAIGGYGLGRRAVMDRQLLSMLDEELGPGVQIKRAYVEEGFKEILRELQEAKKTETYDFGTLKGAIKDLKEGRGRGLVPSERLLLRKHILGQKMPRPEDAPWLPREKPKAIPAVKPKIPKRPPPYRSPVGKTPLAIAGGLAALAALGLGASRLWPRTKDDAIRS